MLAQAASASQKRRRARTSTRVCALRVVLAVSAARSEQPRLCRLGLSPRSRRLPGCPQHRPRSPTTHVPLPRPRWGPSCAGGPPRLAPAAGDRGQRKVSVRRVRPPTRRERTCMCAQARVAHALTYARHAPVAHTRTRAHKHTSAQTSMPAHSRWHTGVRPCGNAVRLHSRLCHWGRARWIALGMRSGVAPAPSTPLGWHPRAHDGRGCSMQSRVVPQPG